MYQKKQPTHLDEYRKKRDQERIEKENRELGVVPIPTIEDAENFALNDNGIANQCLLCEAEGDAVEVIAQKGKLGEPHFMMHCTVCQADFADSELMRWNAHIRRAMRVFSEGNNEYRSK